MPAQDPLNQLASNLIGGTSRAVTDIFGVSPLRLTLINPRKFFNPDKKFEFSQLLEKAYKLALVDFTENLIDTAGLPITSVLEAANQVIDGFKNATGSFFSFYINPTTMSVNHSKVTQETLTGAGWDFDVLGDNLSNYNFSGTSGNMLMNNLFTLRLSRAYFKFVALEQFYLYNNNDPLLMILDYNAYIGKLISMNYTWDSNDIYQIKYDFTWRGNPLYSFDAITGAGVSTVFNQVNVTDIIFDPVLSEDLFVARPGNIDVFNKEMLLYR